MSKTQGKGKSQEIKHSFRELKQRSSYKKICLQDGGARNLSKATGQLSFHYCSHSLCHISWFLLRSFLKIYKAMAYIVFSLLSDSNVNTINYITQICQEMQICYQMRRIYRSSPILLFKYLYWQTPDISIVIGYCQCMAGCFPINTARWASVSNVKM